MMDRQLKQRVVGAAVLVMLGVIFIPIFLDDGGISNGVPDVADIPPPPDDDFATRVVPLDEADIDDLSARAQAPAPATIVSDVVDDPPIDEEPAAADVASAPPAANEPPTAPAIETAETVETTADAHSSSAPAEVAVAELPSPREAVEAWTVQLGSFSSDTNARRLIDKLRAGGYPAYLERRVDGDTTAFKVRVGPQIRREEALEVRNRLEQEFELKGMLVRYR